MNEGPIRRFTLLVLFQAQQDGATELTITPAGSTGPAFRYKVGDAWYDMSPPPPNLLPGVVAELARLAALRDAQFPQEGQIDLPFGSLRLRWKIRMAAPGAGCVLTRADQ